MTTPVRLKASQVGPTRAALAERQGGRCALCLGKLGLKAPLDPVLDHDHKTGAIRGVLHRGCNSLYGKVENNAARYGVHSIPAFASGIANYQRQHAVNVTGLVHPTHKTEDEKRLARNAKARKATAARRAATHLK